MASHTSNGLQLIENLVSGNELAGITFVASDDSLISKNNILESENGIFTDAESSGNRIDSNNILRNTVDLNNANGLDINVNQNRYSYNNCEISNPSRLCTTAINALQPEQSPGQSTQEPEQERKNNLGQEERVPPSTGSTDRFQTRGIDWMRICTVLNWHFILHVIHL